MTSSEEDVRLIAELVFCSLSIKMLHQLTFYFYEIQKGASSARSDDTKSLKSAIVDWITPRGQSLNPPIP